jgi:hypothetical protein
MQFASQHEKRLAIDNELLAVPAIFQVRYSRATLCGRNEEDISRANKKQESNRWEERTAQES